MDFLALTSQRDMCTAVPDDVDFVIWKDSFGKTVVHCDTCPFLGERTNSSCSCPKRLAYGSVDSTIGLRSGCAITLALAGTKFDQIMDHVGWTSSSTALHYIKLNQVLSSGGAADALSSLALDLADSYKEYNDLRGFTKAFT